LREDRRHIVDDDLPRLRSIVSLQDRVFNLEMAPTEEMIGVALRLEPDACTLVPERREERTTEGGLDVVAGGDALARNVGTLAGAGIKVSLFIAADARQIERSRAIGAAQIELHTGEYAHGRRDELRRIAEGARLAHGAGLDVAAGHGLTQENVSPLMAVREIVELNIGHALVSDAVFIGLRGAVRGYLNAIERGIRAR
jgi:pyridoxine 5-phosphate synthase